MKLTMSTLALAFIAGTANAATVAESTVGEFSSDANNPTVIVAGTDSIEGTGSGNNYDIFRIDGLSSGAQDLTFTFVSPANGGNSYAAGGNLYYSTTPFAGAWSGTSVGSFGVFAPPDTDQMTLSLDASFTGSLYVGLYFTFGSDLAYTIDLAQTIAPVPLPASGVMFLSGLMGLGLLRRRKT